MRILLVEDDTMIGKSVQLWLKREGHAVDWVRDGVAAELSLANGTYEFLLLDLGLPRKSGLEVLAGLRGKKNSIPVLILTARDAVADRVAVKVPEAVFTPREQAGGRRGAMRGKALQVAVRGFGVGRPIQRAGKAPMKPQEFLRGVRARPERLG